MADRKQKTREGRPIPVPTREQVDADLMKAAADVSDEELSRRGRED